MINFLKKLQGDGAPLPLKPSVQTVALAGLGGFIAIATAAYLTDYFSIGLILGSFGASCALVFGYPDAPFSQPRNVIAGHFISSLTGLAVLGFMGPQWWAVALAVGLAIMLMMLTRTVHPPAGSNPVIIFLIEPAWDFLVFPTLAGAVILIVIALIYNNIVRAANYPKYW